jgi:hypothetical protein
MEVAVKKAIALILSLTGFYVYGFGSKAPKVEAPKTSEFKSLFPKKEWTSFALAAVQDAGLEFLNPTDAKSFCPNGMSAHNWVHLLAAMAKYESGFNPNQEYKESFTNGGAPIISTGLLQISLASGNGYGCGFSSTNDIKDPQKNLKCGTKILKKWVSSDGVISSSKNKGGARYWSVLRSTGKLSSVKATLKPWCE